MEHSGSFELCVVPFALDTLIDVVHDAAMNLTRRVRRVEPHDNVAKVSLPRISDLDFEDLPARQLSGRPVAAIAVEVVPERVAVVFKLDSLWAMATFTGASALADQLATATNARLAASGCWSRFTRPDGVERAAVTGPRER
jgi:hypothetical protein